MFTEPIFSSDVQIITDDLLSNAFHQKINDKIDF